MVHWFARLFVLDCYLPDYYSGLVARTYDRRPARSYPPCQLLPGGRGNRPNRHKLACRPAGSYLGGHQRTYTRARRPTAVQMEQIGRLRVHGDMRAEIKRHACMHGSAGTPARLASSCFDRPVFVQQLGSMPCSAFLVLSSCHQVLCYRDALIVLISRPRARRSKIMMDRDDNDDEHATDSYH